LADKCCNTNLEFYLKDACSLFFLDTSLNWTSRFLVTFDPNKVVVRFSCFSFFQCLFAAMATPQMNDFLDFSSPASFAI